jgi:hypothetical protein
MERAIVVPMAFSVSWVKSGDGSPARVRDPSHASCGSLRYNFDCEPAIRDPVSSIWWHHSAAKLWSHATRSRTNASLTNPLR